MNAAFWLLAALLACLTASAVALAEPSAGGTAPAGAPALLDLNRAGVAELTSLPGIGEKRAQAILAFRESHGGFRSVTQLLRIKGIGRAMLRKLRLLVTISSQPPAAGDGAWAGSLPAHTGSAPAHRVR